MSNFSHDSGPPPEPPVTPPARQAAPGGPVPAAHRRELSPEELASLPIQALLVRSGRLSIDQLSEALRENVSSGRAVEDIAVSRGWVPADELEELRRAKAAYAPQPQAPAPAPAPMPAPQAVAPPPVEPIQTFAAPPPAPAAAPQAPPVAPPPAPAPAAAPAPAPVAEAPRVAPPIIETNGNGSHSGSVGVFLTLTDGERIWVGRFANAEAGERRAQEVIDALMRPEPGVWPRFGNRLVRPDSVVAVEVSKRADD
jgi:hypothetical protein